MPQISKKKLVGLSLAGGALVGVSTTNASADSIVSATTKGEGVTVIKGNSQAPNQSVINNLNSQIQSLQAGSNGIIKISETPTIVTNDDVEKTKQAISQLSSLVQQYNELKAQLNAQNQNNLSLVGMSGPDNSVTATGSTLNESISNMQQQIEQMKKMKLANDNAINQNIVHSTQNQNELVQKVIEANKQISQEASNSNQTKNGIVGNLDEINRKSQDSEAQGGIVVDNSKTQQVNTVQTDLTVKDKVFVNRIDAVDAERDKIIQNIRNQKANNDKLTLDAQNYKANAVYNIDDLNQWLKDQKAVAEQAKKDSEPSTTSITKMDDYKKQTLDKLNQALNELKSKNASQQMIDKVQKAIDQVNKSNITKEPLPPVGQKEPYDFGDIGQKQDVQNGSQDGTIANTKSTEEQKIKEAIANGVKQVQQSNQQALDFMNPKIDKNTKQVDDFLEKINKGGIGSQIDDSFLDNRHIYTNNDTNAIKDFYQKYIKNALAQTESNVDSVMKQIDNDDYINHVSGNPSIAQLSAAIYARNAGTMGDGFGSVMLRDTNINRIVGNIEIPQSRKVFADSRVDGGAQAVYNALLHLPGYALSRTAYSELPALKDLNDQYLHPNGSEDPKHAENTLTLVTNSPTIRVELPDSFVYTDSQGNTKTARTYVDISATTYDGRDINDALPKTESGSYALYVYNLQINPYTGQLVTGTSYIAMQGKFAGSGTKFPNLNAGGEHMDLNDFNTIGGPQDQTAAKGVGLAQSIRVFVEPWNQEALKYAKHAPLYISDIDDKQQLIAYTGTTSGKGPKIVTAENSGQQLGTSDWKNPYGQTGQAISITSYNSDRTTGTTQRNTNLDSQSAAIYNVAGDNSQLGLSDIRVTMRSKGDASTNNTYMAIDTALFAPFGIVGQPNLDLEQINTNVKTSEVNIPTAKAHTEGQYKVNSEIQRIEGEEIPQFVPTKNMSVDLTLPQFKLPEDKEKRASSNTSMIVKRAGDTTKKTASGNSLTVRSQSNDKITASGNSLVVRTSEINKITASGNSLVVRTTEPIAFVTGSGNSLTVQTMNEAVKNNDITAIKLHDASPVITKNTDGSYDMTMSLYIDPSLDSTAKEAINDWVTALKSQNINLKPSFANDINTLSKGVTLAILEANDDTEVTSSKQNPNEIDATMAGIGGLTTKMSDNVLTGDGENDKFNASGTVTAGDILRNSKYAIQLNTQGLQGAIFKNSAMNGKLNVNVLKHEIGHVFGLEHDDSDTLMSRLVTDKVFTGEISTKDAKLVADKITNM